MRIFKYFLVGGVAATVDIGFFSFFTGYLNWSWLPISIATFILATLVNYVLSIKYVFESGIKHKRHTELVGVFIVSGLALFVNQFVLYIAIEYLSWPLLASKFLATGLVFFWNYLGRSKFVFTTN